MQKLTFSLSFVLIALFASPAFAGGAFVNTIQSGSWLDGSTWNIGRPPDAGAGEQATINHDVLVDGPGAGANVALVGDSVPARVTIDGGGLNVDGGQLYVGSGAPGELFVASGSLGGILGVGALASGTLSISGGSLTLQGLQIASFGGTLLGHLIIEGGQATIDARTAASTSTLFGPGARVVVRPTTNGPAGLSTILTPAVQFEAGATLELDTSSYAAQVGDAWDIIDYTGTAALGVGGFTDVSASPGWTVEQDTSVSGVITLRVTEAPAPSTVPLTGAAGQAVLLALLLATTVVALRTRSVASS